MSAKQETMTAIAAMPAGTADEAPDETKICDFPSLVEDPNGYQISEGMDGAI
jgi:hypothetical protein